MIEVCDVIALADKSQMYENVERKRVKRLVGQLIDEGFKGKIRGINILFPLEMKKE